jgi:cation transporter-like permease
MPKLISALTALIVGYLDGAGLGAASYDALAGLGPDKDLKIALVAGLVMGPLGALLGLLVALTQPSGAEPAKPAE